MQYTSDVSQFISQLKEERPYLETKQQQGRALLWDKKQNTELQKGFQAAQVRQRPYVYQAD